MFYGTFPATEWCAGCGRKLGGDGHCIGCDAWWSSPLITVGGPLVGATLFFLAVTIGVLRANDPTLRSPSGAPAAVLAARPAGKTVAYLPSAGPVYGRTGPRIAPPVIPPPVPMAAIPGPSEGEKELDQLRGMLNKADAAIAAQDAVRLGLVPPSGGFAASTPAMNAMPAPATNAWIF